MMGGAEKILAKGKELYEQGNYRAAMEILNKLVYAEPHHQEAKDLLADTFEQIGYQKESPSVRNSFLAAAFELRNGFPQGVAAQPVNPDLVVAMSTELFLDFLAIQVDSKKAEGLHFTLNLHTPDNDETFIVELNHSTLTNVKGFQLAQPDLTLVINRSDLEGLIADSTTLPSLISAGRAKLEGDAQLLHQFREVLVPFSPSFAIMPGTQPAPQG
jgi:alkyl sulfatase BDS1-like metallo-beta-lactamase superfamily hydrolase